jgi:hypothetical protein
MSITMEIITCTSNCEKEKHRSSKDAAATNSETTCLQINQSPGDSPFGYSILAEKIAAHLGALDSFDIETLVETVEDLLTAAAAEAVATYKLSSAATALAAVTSLAESAVKAAADAGAAAAEHAPRMDYSLEEAAWQLSRGLRAIQYELAEGILIGTHKGASHRISHAELQRQVLRDDGQDGQKRGKRKPPNSDRPAGSSGSKSA